MSRLKTKKKFNRRQFLKASGAAGVVVGGAGLGFFGYESGKDPNTYTGWIDFQGSAQTFDRKKHAVDRPHYDMVGTGKRVDARTGVIFERFFSLMNQWNDKTGIEGVEPYLQEYYKQNPQDLEMDLFLRNEIYPKRLVDKKKFGNRFILSNAWSKAMGAVEPPPINYPPEISDFPGGERFGEPSKAYKMKSPQNTSRLIKKIAYEFGATLVGITRLNPDWVYLYPMRERGFNSNEPLKVPEHWTFAIAVGTPMSWDPLYANPNYGTSNDAYSRSRIIAFRLASFIRQLGYAARPHTPSIDYDLMVPPILVDSGLGEQGRHSVIITPELGSNFRPAVVTTNLPLLPDKPISFGVQDFCRSCKICADNCPSGAISKGEKKVVRGYLKYQLNASKCHNFWYSNMGNIGCRICVAVCPYTRKSNWLHRTALQVSANDPTAISHKFLIQLQKFLYSGPQPSKYYSPSFGGDNLSFREPPWWLRSKDFIEF